MCQSVNLQILIENTVSSVHCLAAS